MRWMSSDADKLNIRLFLHQMAPLTIRFVLTIWSLGVPAIVGVLPCAFSCSFRSQNICVALKMVAVFSENFSQNIVTSVGRSRKNLGNA